ncbi:hypothetical protein AMTRI_Chr02g213190 [Amborella trichopoda]
MASLTLSTLGSSIGTLKLSGVSPKRVNPSHGSMPVIKASMAEESESNTSQRRSVMLALAAAAMCSAMAPLQQVALAAEGDFKRGTPEAKKYYAPVCVTMPTARICRK